MSKARPTRTRTRFCIACLSVTAFAASIGGGASAALAAAPTVFSTPSTPKSQHEVEISSYVNPHGTGLTDCHFEYGPTESYGTTVPCTPAAPGTNEAQEVTVSATQGQFKLSFEGESTTALGTGSTVAGSNVIKGMKVTSGAFFTGMEVSGPGVPPGTKITSDFNPLFHTSFTVSQNLTATAEAAPLEANLPFDANPNAVGGALEGTDAIGRFEVDVVGGPGDASGSNPYRIVFQRDLGGTDVEQLVASDGPVPLSGGTGITVSAGSPEILGSSVRARADVSGLDPGATYHFRLSVTNGLGSASTEDTPFAAWQVPEAPPTCNNAELRVEQHATYLPDCRAYEMVSPLDKNGGDVIGEGRIVYPTADGETVSYAAKTGFADTIGSGLSGRIQYMARRGAGGWSTRTITPTPNPAVNQAFGDPTFIVQFSDQMDKVGLYGTDLPQRDDDIFMTENFYLMNTGTRALETVTRPLENDPVVPVQNEAVLQPLWHSGDFEHVTFASRFNFTAEVSGTTQSKVYDYTEGEARVAGILPDGTIPSKGADGARPTESGEGAHKVWRGDEISHDGSRIFFRSPVKGTSPPPQLYVRKDGTSTDWITESERTPLLGQASGVTFQWASEDGHTVIFSTATQLTDDDPGGGGEALYRYAETPDPSSEANLTFLTRMGAPSLNVPLRVVGASDDASRFYLLGSGYNLYAWDEGDIRFIAGLESTTALRTPVGENEARVSADGRRLAFRSANRLTSDVLETQQEGVGLGQMYVYDLDAHSLVCASCVKGATTRFASYYEPRATWSAAFIALPGKVAFMSEDGRHVFIDTKSRLLAEDTNGTEDVYDYQPDTGTVELITSGHDPEPSGFSAASSSGRDVFIATRERLVAQDTDDLVDLYDVRTEGGYPAPPPVPAPCVGDGCHDVANPPPPPAGAGSSTLIGRGNAAESRKPAKRRCRKAAKRAAKRPKQRCARKNRDRPQPSPAGHGNGGEGR